MATLLTKVSLRPSKKTPEEQPLTPSPRRDFLGLLTPRPAQAAPTTRQLFERSRLSAPVRATPVPRQKPEDFIKLGEEALAAPTAPAVPAAPTAPVAPVAPTPARETSTQKAMRRLAILVPQAEQARKEAESFTGLRGLGRLITEDIPKAFRGLLDPTTELQPEYQKLYEDLKKKGVSDEAVKTHIRTLVTRRIGPLGERPDPFAPLPSVTVDIENGRVKLSSQAVGFDVGSLERVAGKLTRTAINRISRINVVDDIFKLLKKEVPEVPATVLRKASQAVKDITDPTQVRRTINTVLKESAEEVERVGVPRRVPVRRPPTVERLGIAPPAAPRIERGEDVLLRERIRAEARGARAAKRELPERKAARMELQATINRLGLKKWENVRAAMKLPRSLRAMSPEQMGQLESVLKQYKTADEFLPTRMLETLTNTELAGLRTDREVLEFLAKKKGLTVEAVSKIKPTDFGKFERMRDIRLARQNPFLEEMVLRKNKTFLESNARIIELSDEADKLIKLARRSRKEGTILERLVPTDPQIVKWLEADTKARTKLAEKMTSEELRAAQYMDSVFREYYDYLVRRNAGKKLSRFEDKYFPHIRRDFFEGWKEDGFLKAWKELFDKYAQDSKYLNILDEKTGKILPYQKWIGFTQFRTDKLVPTKNAAKAFEGYITSLEKARGLDAMIPEMMAYVHVLTPKGMTKTGLKLDDRLKTFVKEWINVNKGRKPKRFFAPGSRVDLVMRASMAVTRMLDLGFNFTTQLGAPLGEKAANITMLKPKAYATAMARITTKQGRAIVNKYENFVGRSFFKDLARASDSAGDKLMSGMFAIYHMAARNANETFLLGKLTPNEFKTGIVSTKRLAQIQLEMSKYRVVKGTESIMGRTPEAQMALQYKSWAVPILESTLTNIGDFTKLIKKDGIKKAMASDAGKELFYSIGIGTGIGVLSFSYYQELAEKKDRTFLENTIYKGIRDAMSMIGALNPVVWTGVRVLDFYGDLAIAITDLVKLSKMKTTGELKGLRALKRTITPSIIKQVVPREEVAKKKKGRLRTGVKLR